MSSTGACIILHAYARIYVIRVPAGLRRGEVERAVSGGLWSGYLFLCFTEKFFGIVVVHTLR